MSAPVPAVVIVDDDPAHAAIARIVVGRVAAGMPVTMVTDARLAQAGVGDAPFGALVLVDRMLDGLDSTLLVGSWHRQRPDLRLVLLSAALGESERRAALEAGAVAAVEKPPSIEAWCALVGGLLAPPEPARAAA